jgi:hypothetical protein
MQDYPVTSDIKTVIEENMVGDSVARYTSNPCRG